MNIQNEISLEDLILNLTEELRKDLAENSEELFVLGDIEIKNSELLKNIENLTPLGKDFIKTWFNGILRHKKHLEKERQENKFKMSIKSQYNLIRVIETKLDTLYLRRRFLEDNFENLLSEIDIESSDFVFYFYHEFEKRNMLGSLIACLNSHFKTNLNLEFK